MICGATKNHASQASKRSLAPNMMHVFQRVAGAAGVEVS